MKKWKKVLNSGGNFKMCMSTKVCSNHFAAGYCSSECRIPTLFLKGYDVPCSKRSSPRKRLFETQSDYNGTRTHSHLVRKRTLNHFYSIPHIVISFANFLISTLKEIIFAGTKFCGMFFGCIKLLQKYRGKKVWFNQKKIAKNGSFCGN